MKKLSILSILLLGFIVFSSCDKGDMGPVMNTDPGSPSMEAPESGQSYTLDENAQTDTLLTFEWTHPNYGFSAAPNITIEMVETGNDFSESTVFATTSGNSYGLTVGDMNDNLLGLGYTPLEEVSLDFRVKASINDTSHVSDAITLNFTPYSTCEYCPEVYVPGNYQSASNEGNDWDPETAPALHTVDLTDNYEGYVYMANDNNEFKITAERAWTKDWGSDGTEMGLVDGEGESNISQPNAGYYKMNVNINRLEYSMTNTQWGLIGSATANGWDSDQDMTYDPNNQVWTITTDLSAGEMKFRANDAWNIEYGDNEGDGELDAGGGNISVSSAGNYTITLDLSSSPYTYTVSQN